MSRDFIATIREGSPRYQEWLNVMGSNDIPLKLPIPGVTDLPSRGESHVFAMDLAALTEEQRKRLIQHIAREFEIDEIEVASTLDEVGCPILDEDITITIYNPQKWLC